MILLTAKPIEPRVLVDDVRRDEAEAVIVFEGVTRNHHDGREVVRLEYEAYSGMAETEMERIVNDVQQRWSGARISMAHPGGSFFTPSKTVRGAGVHR